MCWSSLAPNLSHLLFLLSLLIIYKRSFEKGLGMALLSSSGVIAFSHSFFFFPHITHMEWKEWICFWIDESHSVIVHIGLSGLLMPFEFLKSLLCKCTCVLGLASDYRISRDYTVCLMSSPSFLSDLWLWVERFVHGQNRSCRQRWTNEGKKKKDLV